MKVCIAIDSFKGSLSTFEAGEAARRGVKAVYPKAEISVSPLADGGEGTVEAIVSASGGKMIEISVNDPLGKKSQGKLRRYRRDENSNISRSLTKHIFGKKARRR